MATLEELEQKLNDTQRDLEKVLADFYKFIELKNALQSSDASLKTSSDNIASLAVSLEDNARGLKECTSSLQVAVAMLSTIGPKRVVDRLQVVESRLGEAIKQIELVSMRSEELPTRIRAQVKEVSKIAAAKNKGSSAREWILLLMVTLILGASLLSLYLSDTVPSWLRIAGEASEPASPGDLPD